VKGVRKVARIGEAKARLVYMRYGSSVMECELYDQHASKELPPELHIICPDCGGESIVPPSKDPTKKTIHIEYLDKPRQLEMPDNGEVVYQTCRVSIDEPIKCGWPAKNGKGRCFWKAVIRDNVVSKV